MYYESRAKKFILGFLFLLSLLPYAVMLYMGINGATNGGGFNLGESTEPMPKGIDGFITDMKLAKPKSSDGNLEFIP